MPTYILLGTLTEEGASYLHAHPEWVEEVKQDLAKSGVEITAQYAVLGPYDIVTIVEAPDNHSMVRVSTQLTLHGVIKITTLPAIDMEDFIASL